MADRQQPEGIKATLQEKSPSTSQVMSVITLLPIGGLLLALSGIILTGTTISLALATPVFIIFSPVLVPAALLIGLAVTGFLASGAFGLTGVSSLSWMVNYLKGLTTSVPEGVEHVKRRAGEMVGHMGQRTKDVGQGIQNRAHDATGAGK